MKWSCQQPHLSKAQLMLLLIGMLFKKLEGGEKQ
jgi:hypothetical protein